MAAIVPFKGKKVNAENIKSLCLEKLERNSIPSYIQIVDEIPKTVSEKSLDRVLRDNFKTNAPNVIKI